MEKGLSNPALIAAIATSQQGQKTIGNTLETANNTVKTTVSIVKSVFVLGLLFGAGTIIYYKVFNGFKKLPEDKKMKPTISTAIAKNKANSIFRAMYGVGSGFETVMKQLTGFNGKRLNANDFVRIYNEFGKRAGAAPFAKKQTMLEWFTEFNELQLLQIKALFPDFI